MWELENDQIFAVSGAASNLPFVLSPLGERSAALSILEATHCRPQVRLTHRHV